MKIIYQKSNEIKPTIFLDRDGVINKVKSGKYITSVSEVKIYPSFIEGFKKLDLSKYHLIIITNQSAINRGFISLDDSIKINDYIVSLLKDKNIFINAVYFCPHTPSENCTCRKPKTGLIAEAKKDFKIDFKDSYYIGDKKSDMELSRNVGLKSIFVLTGEGKRYLDKLDFKPDFVLNNLKNIYRIIK
jgi:histidinol-phosphate phosphatase family protein